MGEDKQWTKLPPIEGGHGGCLNCGYQHAILPMGGLIAVGVGEASLRKNGKTVYRELRGSEDFTVADAEKMAVADPDNDWRIHLVAPLSERYYQRQGPARWVLYKRGDGFA